MTEALSPSDWVRHIGGHPVRLVSPMIDGPMEMGLFSFIDQPESFSAPPLNAHFLSVTVKGDALVERVLSGEALQSEFSPGTCIIMAAGQENSWRWSTEMDEVHFFINTDFFDTLANESGYGNVELTNQFAFTDHTISRMAMVLLSAYGYNDLQQSIWVESAAQLLGLHLLTNYTHGKPVKNDTWGLTQRQLKQVKAFFTENIDQNISLSDLANVAGLSRYHFSRLFRRSVGQSPLQWVTDRRISAAKSLLAETEQPISAVANAVGFENQSHFGQVFRKRTGLSPRNYRLKRRM